MMSYKKNLIFFPLALLFYTLNVHGMKSNHDHVDLSDPKVQKKFIMNMGIFTFQALNTMDKLVTTLTEYNQKMIATIKILNLERPLQCSELKKLMAEFTPGDHWSTFINKYRYLPQPIKAKLHEMGKGLEAKYIHLAEPWILNEERILGIDELKKWRDNRIEIHHIIIKVVNKIALSFYPYHFADNPSSLEY